MLNRIRIPTLLFSHTIRLMGESRGGVEKGEECINGGFFFSQSNQHLPGRREHLYSNGHDHGGRWFSEEVGGEDIMSSYLLFNDITY